MILSGTGSDGTAGLEFSKDMGGVIAVQSLEEARYDEMPFSAISTKLIDVTLPAGEIIPRLHTYFEGHSERDLPKLAQENETLGPVVSLSRIFDIVNAATGNDFSSYKPSMLLRRLKRRMQVCDMTSLPDYLDVLQRDKERMALSRDFLINVTSFIRDWEQFKLMRVKVIKPLIEKSSTSDEVRIWGLGCSSD